MHTLPLLRQSAKELLHPLDYIARAYTIRIGSTLCLAALQTAECLDHELCSRAVAKSELIVSSEGKHLLDFLAFRRDLILNQLHNVLERRRVVTPHLRAGRYNCMSVLRMITRRSSTHLEGA